MDTNTRGTKRKLRNNEPQEKKPGVKKIKVVKQDIKKSSSTNKLEETEQVTPDAVAKSVFTTPSTTCPSHQEEKWGSGEKILCFHGPLIYEAKIQQVEMQNGIPKYFIHYRGWNKNWDEWVPEARMLKYSEKNVQIQKNLSRAHDVKERKKRAARKKTLEEETVKGGVEGVEGGGSGASGADHVFAVPRAPSPVPHRTRRKAGLRPKKREVNSLQTPEQVRVPEKVKKEVVVVEKPPDNTVESEEQFNSKVEIRIKIPDELKSYIVDDWEEICKHKKLCVLPPKLTAEQLIQDYIRTKTANKSEAACKNNKEKAILEVTAGMREYFNVMLPTQLLYKQERQQYEQVRQESPTLLPVKLYGAVHLLRLFVKLGEMLIYTPLSEKSVNLLLFYVHDLLMYMKKNASMIFSLSDYSSQSEQL